MDEIVLLGRMILEQVEEADLEAAARLAAERHRQLRDLLDDPEQAIDGEALAPWLQGILREDRALMAALSELRGSMERELGASRRSLRGARAYAAVAEGHGG